MSVYRMFREAERIFWVAAYIGFVAWVVCAGAYYAALAAEIAPPDWGRIGSVLIGLCAALCALIAIVFRCERLLREAAAPKRPPAPAKTWIPRVVVSNEDVSAELTRAAMERASRDYARARDGGAA